MDFELSGDQVALVEGIRSLLQGRFDIEGVRRLEAAGIVNAELEPADARRINYRLTKKGIELAPVLLELLIWGARHASTSAPSELIEQMEKNRNGFLAEVRRRWEERDPTPLIPRFGNAKRKK